MSDLGESIARHTVTLAFVAGSAMLVVAGVTLLQQLAARDNTSPAVTPVQPGEQERREAIWVAHDVLCMGVDCAEPVRTCASAGNEPEDNSEITRALEAVGGTYTFDLDRRWATREGTPPRHRIVIGTMTTSGGLAKLTIKRHVKRSLAKISRCYERYRDERLDFEGTIYARFLIDRAGRVDSPIAAGFDSDVGLCVSSVIFEIEFPKLDRANYVDVVLPITFYASHASSMVAGR